MADAAIASAAQAQLASQSSAATIETEAGSAGPRAHPSSIRDLEGGRHAMGGLQRARALQQERDMAGRLRQHLAEV